MGSHAEVWFDSRITDGTAMPVITGVQWRLAILMPVCKPQQRGVAADIVKCEHLTCGNCPDECSRKDHSGESISVANSAQCGVAQQKNSGVSAGSKLLRHTRGAFALTPDR